MQPVDHRLVLLAQDEARRLGHEYVGTEHLLLALTQSGSEGDDVLGRLALDKQTLRRQVELIVQRGNATEPANRPLTQRTQTALRLARDLAAERGDDDLTATHVLVGLLREQRNIAAQVLIDSGASEANALATLSP